MNFQSTTTEKSTLAGCEMSIAEISVVSGATSAHYQVFYAIAYAIGSFFAAEPVIPRNDEYIRGVNYYPI